MEQNGLVERRQQHAAKMIGQIPESLYAMLDIVDLLPTRIGCKHFDAADEWIIADIAKFIIEEYKKLSPEEVLNAFTLAAKRKLYFQDKPLNPSTYGQKLNVSVVGYVLTAYKQQMAQEGLVPKYVPRNQKQLGAPSTKMNPKDAYDMLVGFYEKDDWKAPKIFGLWGMVHTYLIKAKKYDFNPKEVLAFEEKAKQMSLKDASRGTGVERLRVDPKELESNFKHIAVTEYFNKHVIPKKDEK
jgi:hypothetical protein